MQIEEIELLIQEALEYQLLIETTTWKDGYFNKRCGNVVKLNSHGKILVFRDELGSEFTIHFYHLVGVQRV
jgi:hypothetical protein